MMMGEGGGAPVSPPTAPKKAKSGRKGSSRRDKDSSLNHGNAIASTAACGAPATSSPPPPIVDPGESGREDDHVVAAAGKQQKGSSSSKREKKAAHKRQRSKGGTTSSSVAASSSSSSASSGTVTHTETSSSSSASASSSTTTMKPSTSFGVTGSTVMVQKSRREQLVEELLMSERAHVQNLTSFLHDYVIPLRDKKILSGEELQSLLCNLELIRRWNVEFLNQLESALDDERGFGDIFLEMMPMLRQLYAQYNENYAHAMDHYEKCKKNKDFAAFIESVSAKQVVRPAGEEVNVVLTPTKNFLSFLYLPIQRILAYYSLLKDLVNETPQDHPEYEGLHAALQLVDAAVDHANKLANQRKNIDKVIAIQSQLIGDENTSLAQPHRRFVYEGDVFSLVGKTQKERRLFLFNDVLLCTKKKNKNYLKVDFLEPLEMLRVEEKEDIKDRYTFRLVAAAKEYTLWSTDKAYWTQLIANSILSVKASRPSLPFLADIERKGSKEKESEEDRNDISKSSLNLTSSLSSDEETTREKLIQRIIMWSKMGDEDAIVSEVRRFGARLERATAKDAS